MLVLKVKKEKKDLVSRLRRNSQGEVEDSQESLVTHKPHYKKQQQSLLWVRE